MKPRVSVALLVMTVIAVVALMSAVSKKKPAAMKTVAIDMEALKKTDTNLLLSVDTGFLKVQMSNLTAIAVDGEDGICVAGDRGVEILDTNGVRVGGFAVGEPMRCMAVMPGGDLLTGLKDHIEIFGRDGTRKAAWESPGAKAEISSAAVSPNFVFVADYGHRIVWRYNHAGKLLGRIGDRDDGERKTGFVIPNIFFDVAVARDGSIWAVNPGIRQLEHFTADGRFLGGWGTTSLEARGFCGCCNPTHIALLADGSFVTSEKHIVRIKIYDEQGEFRGIVAGYENFAKETAGLDLAIDSHGRILALDPQAGGVRVYSKK